MASFYEDASLVVIPSGYKTSKIYAEKPTDGSGDLTFTRASGATRVAPNGLIEEVRTNLLLRSNTFNTTWTASNASVTSGQAGYDGTNNAWLLSKSAAQGHISQNPSSSGLETFSVYAKAGTDNWLHFLIRDSASTFFGGYYDLQNGVVGSATGATTLSIQSVGNGWYRCSASFTKSNTSYYRIYPAEGNNDTSGTSGNILIQNAQLETGDIATNYIPTTTAAVSVGPVNNVPRLDYTNSSCPRLLLEPQRTNVMTFSEQINTTNYGNSSLVNITQNALTSPDGYQSADLVIPNTSTGNHGIGKNIFSLTSGSTYTCSLFAKAQGYSKLRILAGAGTGSGAYEFDLVAGTAEAGARIENYGNGWYRCSAPLVPNSGLLQFLTFISNGSSYSYAGNGTSGIAMYGVQVELGSYVTSYIPTLGASVTRVADAASKTGISSLIGQTEGTVFFDGFRGDENEEMYLFLQKNGSTGVQDSIYVIKDGSSIAARLFNSSTMEINILGGTYASNQRIKIAFAYSATSSVLYVNGVQIGTDSSASIPGFSNYQIGAYTNDSNSIYRTSKPINQTLLFTTRLTNAQLAELTTL